MRALSLEWYKARRRGLWLVALSMSVIVFLWMIVGYRNMDATEKAVGYTGCLYQTPILNSIVLPVMISVLVSRLCDMEHKGSAMKELFTMQSRQSLFTAKFAALAIYLLFAVLMQAVSFLAVGKMYGFTEALPVGDILVFALGQWLVSLFIALIIQCLAINNVNQFIPMAAGLVGGFLGLMAMFFPPFIMRLVPSAYYGLLSTVRMNWDSVSRITEYYRVDFSFLDCGIIIVAGLALFVTQRRRFGQGEV